MIAELVNYLLDTAKKHKAVNYVGYKRDLNINDQHNNPYYQFIIETDSLLEKQIVEGIITLKINIDILGFITEDTNVLKVQDNALHIALDFMEFINNNTEYPLEVRDYSILSFDEYTDDNCSGVNITLQLVIPSPLNICEYEDNFIEKEEPIIEELELSNGDDCTNEKFQYKQGLDLKPIKLR